MRTAGCSSRPGTDMPSLDATAKWEQVDCSTMDDAQVALEALLERWRSWQAPTWWKPVKERELVEFLDWDPERVRAALRPHIEAGLVTKHDGIPDGQPDVLYAFTEAGLRRAGKAYYDMYAAQNPGVLEAMGRVD